MKENNGERFAEQQNMKKVWDQIIHFDKQSLRRRLPGSGSQGSSFWLLVVRVLTADGALQGLSGMEVRPPLLGGLALAVLFHSRGAFAGFT